MSRACVISMIWLVLIFHFFTPDSILSQPTYSLDDWMSVSAVTSFAWSPDGTYIYYTSNASSSGTTEIFRVRSEGGEPTQLTVNPAGRRPEPKQRIVLSADGSTLYYVSARYFQNYTNLYSISSAGGSVRQITFNDAVIETAPAPSPDGKTLAYFARTRRGAKILLLDLEEQHGWPHFLEPGDDTESFPVWSPDGKNLAFVRGGDLWIRSMESGSSKKLIEPAHAGGNRSPVWSPDGRRIAYLAGRSGYSQVGVVDLETGQVTPITYSQRDHGDVAWSPDGSELAFVQSDETGMSRHVVVTPATGGEIVVLTRGKGVRQSPRFSPDGRFLAYIEQTGTRTADIWKISGKGGEPHALTRSMGVIDPKHLIEPEEISYAGPDNIPIPTILYKPRDVDPARKCPVIVRLHGHPGQWNHSFYLMWQYFVQKGFVIIAPNPRGSRGFGQGFHDLHIADYGGTEFLDVMNVLDYLETQPYVDMSRKATWGGSGGGYMSLVIATEAPKAFEAQVIRAPVSSWKLLAIDRFGASGRAWTPTRVPRRERSEFGGSYAEIPGEYDRRSPINFVENVEIPQLLFHGLRDSSVLPRQSQVWVERMRKLGKDNLIDYVEYPDEDHSLRRYKKTVGDRIVRMERFFEKHLRLDR